MVVGVCRLRLLFAGSGSLKSKRQGLRRIVDRLRHKFNAAVSEVADQDSWQRSAVGICVVGNDSVHVRSMLQRIVRYTEDLYVAQVIDTDVELLQYGADEPLNPLSTDAGCAGPGSDDDDVWGEDH